MNEKAFNIRVYGILITGHQQVLITDEIRGGMSITKFPGGGLEHGEGTIECLKREFMEEMDMEIEVLEHFYTTDFFQPSYFKNQDQVISIYYLVKEKNDLDVKISKKPFDFDVSEDGQSFRLQSIVSIGQDLFTFPIDKKVAEMLRNTFIGNLAKLN